MTDVLRVAWLVPATVAALPIPRALGQSPVSPPPPTAVDQSAEALEVFLLACVGCGLLFGTATFVFWIIMLVDCLRRDDDQFPNATENTKTIWTILLLLSWLAWLYWLAAILYYFLVRRKVPRSVRG